MQSKESKEKVKKWFIEARGTYNFIHWEEKFKLVPVLKLVNNGLELQTGTLEMKLKKVS